MRAGGTDYFFNGSDTKITSTDGGLALSFKLTDATHYAFTATRLTHPAKTFSKTGTLAGPIDRMNIANHTAGTEAVSNLYFNNLRITGSGAVANRTP